MQQVIQCATTPKDSSNPKLCLGGTFINKWWFLPIIMAIYVPLVWVRKIEKFAKTHVFADIMIFATLVACITYATIHDVRNNGFTTEGFKAFNPALWPDAIGFSVYAFEGIGIILPVYEITANKQDYPRILTYVVFFICFIYLFFGEYELFSYGGYTATNTEGLIEPLIIDSLPPQQVFVWFIKVMFCFNLVFSYPLVIYPANMVLESYLFGDWPSSSKEMWCKNLTRTIIVFASCLVAIWGWDNMDKFLSVVGALTCTPISFTLPSLFHYVKCAKTQKEKLIDIASIVLSLFVMVFCTYWIFATWNS
jgi:solute carrier family 36 (proton-coupled amino acid transporter)